MLKCVVLSAILHCALSQKPNVCKNFIDYLTMDPKNCWFNPDVYLDAKDIIKRHGYPVEEHLLETSDHYLLTMYRIPRNNSEKIIYLQHPATTTCVGWIDKAKDSLAFMLWNLGYDVWLGNFRGTYYSRKHKFLNPDIDKQFWNFSFHEMGVYDIPNQIDLIANVTRAKPRSISYAGYSMSSTAALIYASELAEHSAKWIKVMLLMAPSSYMKNVINYYTDVSNNVDGLENLADRMGVGEIIPHTELVVNAQSICRSGSLMFLCMIFDLISFGNLPEEQEAKWYPILHYQVPGGISIKCYMHYMQLIKYGKRFQHFDYGNEKNLEYYHSELPPLYPLEKIQVPVYLMYAEQDSIINARDVEELYKMLPEKAKIYGKLRIDNFTHSSFFYGKHVVDWVYKPIVNLLEKIY